MIIASDVNECGTCNVCCKECQVDELNKPSGILCEHYDAGCKIYSGRPKDCETYFCLWITQQNIDVKYRPDNLKVVFEIMKGVHNIWTGLELEEGALQKDDCKTIVRALNNDGASVLLKSIDGKLQYSLPKDVTSEEFFKKYKEITDL